MTPIDCEVLMDDLISSALVLFLAGIVVAVLGVLVSVPAYFAAGDYFTYDKILAASTALVILRSIGGGTDDS